MADSKKQSKECSWSLETLKAKPPSIDFHIRMRPGDSLCDPSGAQTLPERNKEPPDYERMVAVRMG